MDTGEIYLITNKLNNMQYVGQVFSYVKKRDKMVEKGAVVRFHDHKRGAFSKSKQHQCPKLYDAMQEFGVDKFDVEVLLKCDKKMLNQYEKLFIKKLDTIKNGYNILPGGGVSLEHPTGPRSNTSGSVTLKWLDPEYREDLVQKHINEWDTEEYRAKRSKAFETRTKKNGLPCYVTYRKNNRKEIIGYAVDMTFRGTKYYKSWCSLSDSMEQKLQYAVEYIDYVKKLNSK